MITTDHTNTACRSQTVRYSTLKITNGRQAPQATQISMAEQVAVLVPHKVTVDGKEIETTRLWVVGITSLGDTYVYSPEEEGYEFEFGEREMFKFQENNVLKEFPQAKAAVKNLIKECNQGLEELRELAWKIETECNASDTSDHIKSQRLFNEVEIPQARLEGKKARLERILKWAEYVPPQTSIDLERIRQIPIGDFIKFNRMGFAPCIWHNEKTPSMKWDKKKNRVHCFGCGQDEDVIGVYQQMNNCTFRDAIHRLSPGGDSK